MCFIALACIFFIPFVYLIFVVYFYAIFIINKCQVGLYSRHWRAWAWPMNASHNWVNLFWSVQYSLVYVLSQHRFVCCLPSVRLSVCPIQFKLCCVMHSVFHGTCPAYLTNTVEPIRAGRTRRSASRCHGCSSSSATVRSHSPDPPKERTAWSI